MPTPKVKAHCSYIGTTGYNHHSRDFFRKLSEKIDLKIRNFTVGKSWTWPHSEPHNGESYLNKDDKKLLTEQTLFVEDGKREDFPIYSNYPNEFEHNVNLILSETNHHYFYEDYDEPKIAYNVWESTLQPEGYFNKLKEFDQLWVPSKWQKECSIKQGYNPQKIKVVPEGVDTNTFYPEKVEPLEEYKDNRFKFLLFGRWDYRKSTKEIVETFLSTFTKNEPVDLILSIDNMYGSNIDGFNTTEERLKYWGFNDKRLKIKHFPSREEYISYLKSGNVFVSCARGEGWNLPLIEAMACGTPSIYSECSGQLEFAQGKGLPVKILEERPTTYSDHKKWTMAETTSTFPGNYYEPDFNHLSKVMRDAYKNYNSHKKQALKDAKRIHNNFNWDKVAEIGSQTLKDFVKNLKNEIILDFTSGAKCEVKGPLKQNYLIKFYNNNTGELIWEDNINNNMWTSPNSKFYIEWRVEIWENNNKIYDYTLDLKNQRVYIHLDSKSIGDTIAWFPYVEEFRKKHNCKIICSTFHNNWFASKYPEIKFVKPGTNVGDIKASYGVGWFYENDIPNTSLHPIDFKSQPLQKTASDILGLKFKEIIPKFKNLLPSPIKEKYVTLSIQSTAQCKYWNYPNGWEQIVKHIQSKGYKVAVVDQHRSFGIQGFMNASPECDYHFHNKPLDEVMSIIKGAEFHVGISSGLSWVAWVVNTPTVLISSFTHPNHCEFKSNNIRIYNDTPPSGYFSTHKMDTSDWNWYPFRKIESMEDWYQIETITPNQVINGIKNLI